MAHGRVFAKSSRYPIADIERQTGFVFEWAHPRNVFDGSGVLGIYKLDATGTITAGAIAKIIERAVYVVRAANDSVWPSMLAALDRALKRHFRAYGMGGRLAMLVKPGTIIETRAMPLLSLKI
eukprot:7382548-Prymnesium_polylepis.1